MFYRREDASFLNAEHAERTENAENGNAYLLKGTDPDCVSAAQVSKCYPQPHMACLAIRERPAAH